MLFQKKYKIIFKNESFQVEIENIFFFKELKKVISEFLEKELSKSNSEVIEMLKFLKIVKISWRGIISAPNVRYNCDENKINLPAIIELVAGKKNFNFTKFSTTIYPTINQIFKHELTHLYQKEKTYILDYFIKRRNRLLSNKKNYFKLESIIQRQKINNFFYLTIIEGFAQYLQGNHLQYNYIKKYIKLKNKLYSIQAEIGPLDNSVYNITFTEDKSLYYTLGENIIHTIIENSNFSFLELIEYKFKSILELYEEIMLSKLNIPPLITYSSQRGILDYRKIIVEWNKRRRK